MVVVAWGYRVGAGGKITKDAKELWGDGYGHLFLVTVSQAYMYVKTYPIVYFKHVHTLCQ